MLRISRPLSSRGAVRASNSEMGTRDRSADFVSEGDRRFRVRGLSGVRDEVLLTATAQNLRRLDTLLCRVPPPLAATYPA
jgi:hypothetical protein